MSSLMESNQLLTLCQLTSGTSLLLESNLDAIHGRVNFFPSHSRLILPGSGDGCFIHQVFQLCTTETRSSSGNCFKINVGLNRLATSVHAQDSGTALEIGKIDCDLTIEASRTEKCVIKNIKPVRGSNGDNTRIAIETIHLDQNLIQCLLTFIVTSSESCSALTSNGIDLINEDDARRVLLGLVEHITHTRSSNTNKHLYKFGTRNGDEWHTCLSSNSLGEEGLTSTRGSIEDDTTRNAASVLGVSLGLLQKVNNLGELELGSITSSNFVESYTCVGNHLDLRLGLAHAHGTSRSTHAPRHATTTSTRKEKQSTKQNSRQD
mmetsp:Transcript_2572/g.4000  ORF Transcript_2572/g.4000 Transcript_2572/m.4000 type:complete len:321 (-) Transcript_2572:551-1513(-)